MSTFCAFRFEYFYSNKHIKYLSHILASTRIPSVTKPFFLHIRNASYKDVDVFTFRKVIPLNTFKLCSACFIYFNYFKFLLQSSSSIFGAVHGVDTYCALNSVLYTFFRHHTSRGYY
ncbi:MAG: hypothetical protein UU98_C0002G0052 [Parcubacteria group bacterium GW2011_GWD2_42_14]|nr:MAG: hypothetical protein UU98_C0002G0052 [Parcubacteria group bacterium GW2011_GWD2_42_14]